MASQKTKFAVGLFLTSGIGIAVISLIWLGMSRFLEKGQYYVTYFNESVQGLDRDSPVKYRGVPVGRVDRIEVAPDSRLIQVVMKMDKEQTLDRDIVARLKAVGITGSMFVELDRRNPDEPDLSPALSFPSEYPIVASKPSEIGQILQGIDEVIKKVNRVDFEGIGRKIEQNLNRIDQAITDADVKGLSKSVEASLARMRRIFESEKWEAVLASAEKASQSLNSLMGKGESTLDDVRGILDGKQEVIRAALDDFRKAMENANVLLERGTSLVSGTDDTLSHLKKHLIATGQNLERASEKLDRVIELLSHQPSQLLFGDAPAPRPVEPDTGKGN
ncbi:MAG: MCE family protein [Deltaproteobacteria bacterium]|nr:MCE family protein [Deltaproteobacteria bacterium]